MIAMNKIVQLVLRLFAGDNVLCASKHKTPQPIDKLKSKPIDTSRSCESGGADAHACIFYYFLDIAHAFLLTRNIFTREFLLLTES